MNETTKKRSGLAGVYVILIVLLIGVLVAVGIGVLSLLSSQRAMAMMESSIATTEEEQGATQENDVTIADSYVIRSTEQISNAYLSGDTATLNDKDKETLDMAKAVLDEVIEADMTDFEKEKAIYDWMTHNLQGDSGLLLVIPTTQADADNPYGVLKYHNAVCVGYATTFRLFMQMMEIPCMVVHNTDLYHSWDLVQLDGNWYHTDIYSDAGYGNYNNFNMNDNMCMQGHDWDTSFFPAATSLAYNMAYQNKQDADDITTIPKLVREQLDEGNGTLSLLFGGDLTEADAQTATGMLNQIQELMWQTYEYTDYYMDWSWNTVDDGYLLVINVSGAYEEPDTEDLVDWDMVNEAVDDAFGDLNIVYNDNWYDNEAEG